MQSVPQVGDNYVLPTGKDDAARLGLIHAVYGPISRRGLAAADVGRASRAADIGCSTGTVSRWMASQMGQSGRVDAIDIAPEQIEVAKSTAAASGSDSVHYQLGSAYSPGLLQGAFDVVFCRLVLCHLKEPERAVAEMARLLRPGGRLVLVDLDMRDVFTMPHCESYVRIIDEAVIPYGAKIGTDCSVGLRLPELVMAADLRAEAMFIDQPVFRESPEKHLWEKTWSLVLQRVVREGVISQARSMELLADMERHTANPEVWVAAAKMCALIGRKPA